MKKIFFTIIPKIAGFTDQMMQFSAFYKLGLSLGYSYLHTPFKPKALSFDIYDFIGLNGHFHDQTVSDVSAGLNRISTQFNDPLLRKKNVRGFKDLQSFVKSCVEENAAKEPSLIEFRLTGRRQFFRHIHKAIPEFQDQLDLRSIYLRAREANPRPSKFQDKQIKILVHMRFGDTAIIETPWKTFPYGALFVSKTLELRKYDHYHDVPRAPLRLKPSQYHDFLKKFVSCFDKGKCSCLVFSDGFQRNFSIIKSAAKITDFTVPQWLSLFFMRLFYDKKKFSVFKDIADSRLIIGETKEKLYDLVHNVLHADIIIAGPIQRMIPKLIANYYNLENAPYIIILYRNEKPDYKDIGLGDLEKKVFFVDICDPDIESLAQNILIHLSK